jgi:type II secretory pathway component PulJ
MNMGREKLESLLIDYIDGKLSDEDKQRVEQELIGDEAAYTLYEQLKVVMNAMDKSSRLNPSDKMKGNFEKALQAEIAVERKSKTVFFTPAFYRAAAAIALLVVGGGIGYWVSQQNRQNEELLALQKEMQLTRQLVMDQLNNDLSASQRMLGVKAAYESVQSKAPDDEIVDALVTTMNHDSNSNVRLAAIEALGRFSKEEKVRRALIHSLSVQTDPVVQISLIQLLVQMKETGAMDSFQRIIDNEETLPAVKDEAYAGIFKLS